MKKMEVENLVGLSLYRWEFLLYDEVRPVSCERKYNEQEHAVELLQLPIISLTVFCFSDTKNNGNVADT